MTKRCEYRSQKDSLAYKLERMGPVKKNTKTKGRTRIRTGVAWIKTKSDNHYTIQPITNTQISYIFLRARIFVYFMPNDSVSCSLKIQQSASGLVVKFNVAIVEPPVRFRACAFFLNTQHFCIWHLARKG
jgi:hypothetical protein